jgi:hypothetical protein
VLVTGFLLREGSAYAVYYASTSGHPETPQVCFDVVFGTWGESSANDHVTFSCQHRPEGAMAVDAPAALSQASKIMGVQLTREKALRHPLINEFWDAVDFICLHDPALGNELIGGGGAQQSGA